MWLISDINILIKIKERKLESQGEGNPDNFNKLQIIGEKVREEDGY